MRVAFQGEPGAYSEEAGMQHFDAAEMIPHASFEAVFEAVSAGQCESGLIPIENTLAGSIHRNYDLLLANQLFIVSEYYLRVQHCLIGFPDATIDEITEVISHPQALGQCAGTLRALGLTARPAADTAGSVKQLKESGERSTAAIASQRAAEIYGMQVLQASIEDDSENFTRFLEIRPEAITPSGEAKTSIVFTLNNEPGALFRGLSVFALRDIDLTKIESRPLVGKPWEYLFYVDFIGSTREIGVRRALDHLGEYAAMLRLLGSYPRSTH